MDPDQALADLRQATAEFEQAPAGSRKEREAAERATSAAGALDDWLSHGGFLPRDWRQVQAVPSGQ